MDDYSPEEMDHMNKDFDMRDEFNSEFAHLMDSFMNKWGEYIGDTDDLDQLITDAFDEWAHYSEFFE